MTETNNFYVYFLCDPRKYNETSIDLEFSPFYVGKGKLKRFLYHIREAKKGREDENPHKYRIIRKILDAGFEPVIKIYRNNLAEREAFDLEIKLISDIGTSNLGTGPLTNLSIGGEGNAGYKWKSNQKEKLVRHGIHNPFYGKNHSEETKEKMREIKKVAQLGNKNSFYGKTHSIETKTKLSLLNSGRKIGEFSQEHKNKIAMANKGKPRKMSDIAKKEANKKRSETLKNAKKRIYLIQNEKTKIKCNNLKQWCKENEINYNMMLLVFRKKIPNYRGFSCEIL